MLRRIALLARLIDGELNPKMFHLVHFVKEGTSEFRAIDSSICFQVDCGGYADTALGLLVCGTNTVDGVLTVQS